MRRDGAIRLGAVVMLGFLGLLLLIPGIGWTEDTLRLESVEFPKECPGACDGVVKVAGDLRNVKDLVLEVQYAIQRMGKEAKSQAVEKSSKRREAVSVDAKTGELVFHPRFRGVSKRMATCTLLYSKNGKAMRTNEVKSSWFEVTERAMTPMEGAVQRKTKGTQ